MGVMSIPCCEITKTPIIRQKTGPVLVRAGWYHFLVMSIGGEVTTFVGSPSVVYKTGVTGDYWKPNWGKIEDGSEPPLTEEQRNQCPPYETDRTLWTPYGTENGIRTQIKKFQGGDPKFHPWNYADCTYNLAEHGWDNTCTKRSENITDEKIKDGGILVINSVRLESFLGRDTLGAENGDPPICTEKCYYEIIALWTHNIPAAIDDAQSVWQPSYPTILEDYINIDGSADGLGVTLYEATPCSKGLPKYVTPYAKAQIAPIGHPLETPNNIPGPVVDIVCGAYHNIIKLYDNSIMAWGLNSMGQCNVPQSLLPDNLRPSGVLPHPKRSKICSIHAGYSTSAVLFNDGTVLCWGDPEVSDVVNQWKHLRISPMKILPDDKQQKSCIGYNSEGYPECLPGEDCSKPENWVAKNKYNNGSYNIQNDWNQEWHKGAAPAYPHFDLGVETKYVYPVNWGHLAANEEYTGIPGYDIPTDTDETDVDVPQYSYRYAKKWSSLGNVSLCSEKNKIIKDYAVGMLRTGQIVTTRKTNAPESGKDRLYSRDCNMDAAITRSDGKISVTNRGPAIDFRVTVTSDRDNCGQEGQPPCGAPPYNCSQLSTSDGKYQECVSEMFCDSSKRWVLPDNSDGEHDSCYNVGARGQYRPEGIGCFCSEDNENGYDPNWATTNKYTSAGHVRANYPTWNKVESLFGWSSLPVVQERFINTVGFYEPVLRDCRGLGMVTANISINYFSQDEPCKSECPSEVFRGNSIATPGKRGQSEVQGTPGYFTYPNHMHSIGCVAGTNTVGWLAPIELLDETIYKALPIFDRSSVERVNDNEEFPKSNAQGPSKKVSRSTRDLTSAVWSNGNRNATKSAGCNYIGAHKSHTYDLHQVTYGVIFNINHKDPDFAINPFSGRSNCGKCNTFEQQAGSDCGQATTLEIPDYSMRPSKAWGPFNIEKWIGNLPTPPVLELAMWRYGQTEGTPLWNLYNNARTVEIVGGEPTTSSTSEPTFVSASGFVGLRKGPGELDRLNERSLSDLSQMPWMYLFSWKHDQRPSTRDWWANHMAFEQSQTCSDYSCWSDSDLNGIIPNVGGEPMNCAQQGEFTDNAENTKSCIGTFYNSCSDPIRSFNPNKKSEILNTRGYTLYSSTGPLYEKAAEISSINKDKTRLAVMSKAVSGEVNLFVWDITQKSNKHKLIKFNTISSSDDFDIRTPYKMKWLDNNKLVVIFRTTTGGNISAAIISNHQGGVFDLKPIKFLRKYADNSESLNDIIPFEDWVSAEKYNIHYVVNKIDINQSDGMLCTLNYTTAVENGNQNGLLGERNKQHINLWELYQSETPTPYVVYKLSGVIPVNEALSVVRQTTFNSRVLLSNLVSGISLAGVNAIAMGTNLNGPNGNPIMGYDKSNGDTILQYENVYMRAGGYAQMIQFNYNGNLMLSSNNFNSVVCWGLKQKNSNTKIDGNADRYQTRQNGEFIPLNLSLDIDDQMYSQTFNTENVIIYNEETIEPIRSFNYNYDDYVSGIDAEYIKSNKACNKIAICGLIRKNDSLEDMTLNKELSHKAIQINKIIWGTTLEALGRGARLPATYETPIKLKDVIKPVSTIETQINIFEEGFATISGGYGKYDLAAEQVMHNYLSAESYDKYVSIDDNLTTALIIDLTSEFRGGDGGYSGSFISINIPTKKIQRYFNVFPEVSVNSYSGVELFNDMAVIMSRSTKPYSRLNDMNVSTPIEIPNVFVFDTLSQPQIYKSYPLRNKNICGFRRGLSNAPPLGWTGGGNFECCGQRDNSCGSKFINRPPVPPSHPAYVQPTEVNKIDSSKSSNYVFCPECDQDNSDEYSRWAFLNSSISYATGRSWGVHLRATPWTRHRDRASFFLKVNNCMETAEYNGNEFFEDGGFTKQKSPNHKSGNYDNVKIWVIGDLTDPCPPWPLKSWDSELDIDIDKPRPLDTVSYTVTGSINHKGNAVSNETTDTMNVKYCPKYPSWVPTPSSNPFYNSKSENSYKGSWFSDGASSVWRQGLYAINEGKINGKDVSADCGLNIQNLSDIENIKSSINSNEVAYQDISCDICEKSWTSPLPPESDIVGKTFFRQGYNSPWNVDESNVSNIAGSMGVQYEDRSGRMPGVDILPICSQLKLGSCWRKNSEDPSGWTCSYGSINACSYCVPDCKNPNDAGYFTQNTFCSETSRPSNDILFDDEGLPRKRSADKYNKWCCECPSDQNGCGCQGDGDDPA